MGLLTLVQDSLRKAFTYASTYFSLVKKHAESLTNFLVEQAKARLGTREQLGTEFDEVTHFDQPVVEGLVKNLQATSYYTSATDHIPKADAPSPYLNSQCSVCFPTSLDPRQLAGKKETRQEALPIVILSYPILIISC